MYTQFQRFVATILLFSILLQSCGNPNWKMAEADSPAVSFKTSKPSKAKKRAPANLLQVQDGASGGSVAPKVDLSCKVDSALSAGLTVEASHAPSLTNSKHLDSSNPSPAVPPSVSPTTPLCTSPNRSTQVIRSFTQLKASPKHGDKKPRHIVLNRASVARRVQHEDKQASALSHSFHVPKPASVPQLSLVPTAAACSAHTDLKPSTDDTVHQILSCAVLPMLPTQPYPSAQGHQVRFQEDDGKLLAQVQDGWGRAQLLPVICAPDQSPAQALQKLASKAPGQYKYWVHVLETHQPPWAPRVVYVGAMGLRGGGAVENPIDTTITEAHALPKDAQQAYQIDRARDEKKQDPKQGAAVGTQNHHGRISGNLFESLKHIVKAITIPFDNRPLAPLIQTVNAVVMQLKQYPLCAEPLGMLIKKGEEVMRLMQQQQYTPTLDFNERVLRKTLEEKLSCHLRLYQCIAYWSQHFTDAERDAFEAVIIPIFKKHFLCADTTVQQALLTYWKNGGHCYTNILQDAAVVDWLGQSLCLDIAQEALANNNTLLHDQFMQSVWRLVQHKQGPAQQKLLNQLLWSLRAKQQAYQLDLLTLCKLMEWLPTDGDHAMRLLNHEADDWFHTLKVHRIATHLEDFKDSYQEEELSELCSLLSHLPWDKAITDSFLSAVDAAQDYTAFKGFLLFLKQYPIEESTLLHVFHTELPEGIACPCNFLHHALACELLQEPLKMFDQQSDALYGQITSLLQSHLGAYDALYTLLTTLKAADMTQEQRSEQALQLREVLSLLGDYGAATEVYVETFNSIPEQPANQWDKITHQRVVDATFHDSHELSTQEIIDKIAQHAPGVFFSGDAQKLQSSYEALIAAYQSHASMLRQIQQPIAQWSRETVTAWAKAVKQHYHQAGPSKLIPQGELLAVMKRAVELHHGFSPRATQLLSVLALLNTPENMGRLAQINTGEGKSLIVAMLAALHALQGQKVDVLTTSTELSIPEVKNQRPLFEMLGLTVGENSKKNTADKEARHAIYQKDIVYGTAEDFQADIISTEFFRRNIRGDRGFGVVLVDEVDSMLFDDRSYSTRLSSLTPAMNHLEMVLGTIWNQINLMASRLRTIDGQCYFIKAEKFEDVPGGGVILPEGQTLDSCSHLVDDPVAFLKQFTTAHLETLLRKLTSEDRKKLEAYRAQELRIEQLKEKAGQDEAQQKSETEAAIEALKQEPWSQEKDYLEIPAHLQDFARKQIPLWVESAINALLGYKKDQHYHVKGGKVVPIDYSNTGVLQHTTVLENGLTQFLQIKEGLRVTPEGISTNSISKPGYFQRYGNRLYGLTGTLGNATTRSFLQEMYGVDMITIPPYKYREILGNDASRYLCKELLPRLVSDSAAWYDAIIESVLRPARNGQAVLVICNYISQVHHLKERLAAKYDANKVFFYTGEKDFEKPQIDSGEIILGTNIAGRGTDLTTSAVVEDHGGLHVCITFLPPSYRVELQNAGRTARQGKKGSAQLVLRTSSKETLQTLRAERDEREAQGIGRARQDVDSMLTADRLFMRYCGAEASFFPTMEAVAKMKLSQDMLAACQLQEEELLPSGALSASYENAIQQRVQILLQKVQEPDSWRNHTTEQLLEARSKLKQAFRVRCMQEYSLEKHREAYKAKLQEEYIRGYEKKLQQAIPVDVRMAFLEGRVYVPPGSELFSQYGWEEAERCGSQERWGIWLKEDSSEKDMNGAARHCRFDGFETALKADAQADRLIKNPFYYVEKGNNSLRRHYVRSAVKAYDRAIALDPLYSVNARFNKARALVTPKENKHNHAEAKRELTQAKYLIRIHDRSALLSFDTLVGQTGKKPRTSEHVQYQLDILSQQENYIQAAIDVIERAQKEDWHVEITEIKSIKEVFEKAEDNRTQALEEAAGNGFTHVFTIKEKEPKQWWSIISIALIGLAQITAGVFLAYCTLGMGLALAKGLISEGISDLITAVKAGIQGGFSWAEWGLQKAISLAVSLICAGWDAIKNGFAAVKETAQHIGRAATVIGKQGMNVAMQRVGLELGKSVAKECATALVNYGVDQLIVKNIEEEIAKKVTEKVSRFLEQSTLAQAAIALDIKNENNHWQNLLLQEGLALLAVKKDNKVLYALEEIAKGVASNKIKGAKAVLQSAAMLKALEEVLILTDDFLASFHKKLEKDYEKKIKAEQESQQKEEKRRQQEQEQEKQHQQVNQQVSAPPPIDEEDIEVPLVAFQEDYKSDLRDYYYEAPSNANSLCSAFSSTITSRITNKIQGSMIRPMTGALVNMSMEKMLEGVTKTVEANEEKFCIEGAQYYHANKVGKESEKKDNHEAQEEKASPGNEQSQPSGEANRATKPTSAENKEMAQKVRAGAEAGIAELGAAAAELKQPIAVYDEHGRLLEILGRGHKGPLLKVQHFPSVDGLSGHWVPHGTKSTSSTSGASNCAYDALACQTDQVSSGTALREKVADRLATSVHTMALYHATERLAIFNPAARRRGGNMGMVLRSMQRHDPHSTLNRDLLAAKDSAYAALREEVKSAMSSGNQAQAEALSSQLCEMEVAAFNVRRERERELAKALLRTGAMVGVGMGVTAVTGGTGIGPT